MHISEISGYYSELTNSYIKYGAGTYGWHYGIWDNGVSTHADALLNSNHHLLDGISIGARSHILDVGCGVGGFGVWAAQKFGCKVTGITILAEHVKFATNLAREKGVHKLCRFIEMDMNKMDFGNDKFDVIVNQETFCHASQRKDYISRVHHLLKPGGFWRAQVFSIQENPMSATQIDKYKLMCEGLKIPFPLLPGSKISEYLEEMGFENSEVRDITTQVLPTASHIIRHCYVPLILIHLHLDWLFFSLDPRRRRNHQYHFRAGREYSKGLHDGYFRHYLCTGSRRS